MITFDSDPRGIPTIDQDDISILFPNKNVQTKTNWQYDGYKLKPQARACAILRGSHLLFGPQSLFDETQVNKMKERLLIRRC